MIYKMFSRKSDLTFTIRGNKEFRYFWGYINHLLIGKGLPELKITNGVYIDKIQTKVICGILDEFTSDFLERLFIALVNGDLVKNYKSTTELDEDVLLFITLVLFEKFIKRSRGGFIVNYTRR